MKNFTPIVAVSSLFMGLVAQANTVTIGNVVVSQNEMISTDSSVSSIIFWTPEGPNLKSLHYCKDKNDASTCSMIGTRAYSDQEIAQASERLKEAAKDRNVKGDIMIGAGGAAIVGSVFLGAFAFPAGILSLFTLQMGQAERDNSKTDLIAYQDLELNGTPSDAPVDFDMLVEEMAGALSE